MKKTLFTLAISLTSMNSWGHAPSSTMAANDLLEHSGKSEISFRLLSKENPKQCLDQHQEGERIVLRWSENCSSDSSVLSYIDGGGYTYLSLKNGDYAGFIIKPNLSKEIETQFLAKNLMPANNITQEEFINSLSTDLYEQKDGSFIIADHDQEDPIPHTICVSAKNDQDSITMNAAKLVQIENGDTSVCAKMHLVETK